MPRFAAEAGAHILTVPVELLITIRQRRELYPSDRGTVRNIIGTRPDRPERPAAKWGLVDPAPLTVPAH